MHCPKSPKTLVIFLTAPLPKHEDITLSHSVSLTVRQFTTVNKVNGTCRV